MSMWPKLTYLLGWMGIVIGAFTGIVLHFLGEYRGSVFMWEMFGLGILGSMYGSWIITQEDERKRRGRP